MTENFARVLYDECYKLVENAKMPVVVPSYNRPYCNFADLLIRSNSSKNKCPVFFVVRESQEDEYRESLKSLDNVEVISVSDNTIRNIGLTRRFIQMEFSRRGYENIFMIDDDIAELSYLHKKVNSKGNITSVMDYNADIYKVFAILQFAHEELCKKFKGYMYTGLTPKLFMYHESCSDSANSLEIIPRILTAVVGISLSKLRDNCIEYHNNETHGHEDIDLMFQILKTGNLTGSISGITFHVGQPASTMGFNTSEERFRVFWERCLENHPEVIENKLISYRKKDTEHAHPITRWSVGRKVYCPEFYKDNKFDLFEILSETDRYRERKDV